MPAETEFPKAYVPSEHETAIYEKWESSGAFAPRAEGEPWSLVAPPPNANGNLHLGHALEVAIMDIMTRYQRMQGKRALWVPGADHAGFETQVVFEKKLEKEGRSRFQMTREQFYEEALQFTLDNKGNMEQQLRMLGASADWSAERFTLDREVINRVYKTFRQMYDEGLIYRGERIVNYSVKYQTAYSDLEVIHEDRTDPLYYIKYGPITVATVRPETKFGEKVIVVHPEDDRYKKYIGQTFKVTIATGEELDMTVIADEAIKPEFGTGAMTITPAHDPIDFEIAQRHNLPIIPIIGRDGRMLPIAGEFAGMKVAEARKAVAAKMQELGLIEKIDENYRHSVALCYKSLQPIEPMIMPQWYVKVRPLADKAVEAIEKGEIKIYPEGYKKILVDWLNNLRDWNISRQIWWGIPIKDAMPENPEVANDPDTFDTWFSSGQWPYVVMEAMGDKYLEDFYPTSVMQTGRDLVFLWVSRMIMMGLYTQGQVPFKNLYFHGMILDPERKKMSKSKGNVVAPIELSAKYGTDALRFGLIIGSSAAGDFPLPEEKMVGGRNFANKLWNIARFIMMQLDGRLPSNTVDGELLSAKGTLQDLVRYPTFRGATSIRRVNGTLPHIVIDEKEGKPHMSFHADMEITGEITEADKDLAENMLRVQKEVAAHLEQYRFAQALQALHEFAWHHLADIYLEVAKSQKDEQDHVTDTTAALLYEVLERTLKLAHPFMPFVTEAIWQQLPTSEGLLIAERWPSA